MTKTIWIGADYPFCGQPWEVFGAIVYGRPDVRFIARITANHIPEQATEIFQDEACIIYRFYNVVFQVDKATGEITTTSKISGEK